LNIGGTAARRFPLPWTVEGKLACMILDWTNWTFWLITLALVAFGFCLRDIYEQWYFRKVRKEVRDEVREVHDLTQRLEAATERLNKANADGRSGTRQIAA
jgi:hypothetical protein